MYSARIDVAIRGYCATHWSIYGRIVYPTTYTIVNKETAYNVFLLFLHCIIELGYNNSKVKHDLLKDDWISIKTQYRSIVCDTDIDYIIKTTKWATLVQHIRIKNNNV